MRHAVIVMLAAIIFSACDNHKDCCGPMQVSANTWGHDTFRVNSVRSAWYKVAGLTSLNFFAADSVTDGASISFYFLQKPQSSGTYKIVGSPQADNEVSIITDERPQPGYNSLPGTEQTLEVALDGNGKLSLYSNGVKSKEMLFVGGDTTYVFFNLQEF
jgi:hypothetical protein